ncbi:DNA/RNA helicase domain-containing protein [Trueperella pyogenes]|uniref:DNA/RNA helicase domain-containing protein n=1 Tax=Trueperella pyogenes TaxID=1661 RepID=UPI003C7A8862
MTNNHANSGRDKSDMSRELLQNELDILLTRGVHGLYVYAEDPALREAPKTNLHARQPCPLVLQIPPGEVQPYA